MTLLLSRVSLATLSGSGMERLPRHVGFPVQAVKILGGMVEDVRHRYCLDVSNGFRHVAHKRRFIAASAVRRGGQIGAVSFDQ